MAPRYAMSDSDESEDERTGPMVPPDAAIEKALRDAVARVYKSGKMEELTVKRVRLAAEKTLGLDEGYLKGDSRWKAKSEEIIRGEVDVQDKAPQEEEKTDKKADKVETSPLKRSKINNSSKSRKRRKTSSPPDSEDDQALSPLEDESDVESKLIKAKKQRSTGVVGNKGRKEAPKTCGPSDEPGSDVEDQTKSGPEDKVESESEMSVVLDEAPQPTRKRKSSEGTSKKTKKKAAETKSTDADLDPDQAEIKRLQGWLVKCGIRKMWWRELAPYETSKAKIKHLKEMLKEAGMDGRYSVEKAKQIREARELQADLEMVQEGAKRWGTGSGDEGSDGGGKPRRRLNRGLKSLAFLGSDDGEETD
ncbi:hypothetical protein ASPZODRAFT_165494 [Penicilliopsis zonata CBS 506.65]|uniref:Transcriptional regulator n=1 Tax=Penicilliopsis zonata CBS 506.65 TaxID=1073090 RepID=A0A1L9SNG5_9EURO|nr:hypothetical protein ASPZODRAFT_165494 [Penicilliopsis zonata CBS 506.65]OJJ48653.1 hypothetical protein ASPZODRAFT_165494 [Penicilliopsis zonata CBS 506.65]